MDGPQESYLFDLVSRKELVPAQHLLIQGFPVPGLCSDRIATKFPFPSLVSARPDALKEAHELRDQDIRHVAGKGFHLSAIGAVLMFAWGSSKISIEHGVTLPSTPIVVEESQD